MTDEGGRAREEVGCVCVHEREEGGGPRESAGEERRRGGRPRARAPHGNGERERGTMRSDGANPSPPTVANGSQRGPAAGRGPGPRGTGWGGVGVGWGVGGGGSAAGVHGNV